MKRSIVKLSSKGHEVVAEWEVESVSGERLTEIEREFNQLIKQGYIPADVSVKGEEVIVDEFKAESEYVMIPRIAGGMEG